LKTICGDKIYVVLQSSADTLAGCEEDTPSMSTINYSEASINISQATRWGGEKKKLWDSITYVMNTSKQKMKTTFATFAYRYSSDVNNTANRCKQCCNYSEEHWQKYSSMDCCTGTQCRGVRVVPKTSLDGCGEKKIFPLLEFAPPQASSL